MGTERCGDAIVVDCCAVSNSSEQCAQAYWVTARDTLTGKYHATIPFNQECVLFHIFHL